MGNNFFFLSFGQYFGPRNLVYQPWEIALKQSELVGMLRVLLAQNTQCLRLV